MARESAGSFSEWQRDVFAVAVSVVFGAVLFAVAFTPLFHDPVPTHGWWHIALFAAICVVELFRRRAPVTAVLLGLGLLTADGFLGASLPIWIVFADLLYAVTRYGPRRLSRMMVPIVVLGFVGVLVLMMAVDPNWEVIVVSGVVTLPVLVIPVAWALNVRQHQETAEAERTHADQLVRINELDRSAAVAEERARMARDLHDVVSGHLSAIAIQSEAVLSLEDANATTVHTALTSVRENSVRALREMRSLVDVLRSDQADDVDVPARLADLSPLVESARASGMRVEYRSNVADDAGLPAAVDLAAYRIAQEALTNAMKHAPKARVSLDVRCTGTALVVEVVNQVASPPEPGDGGGRGLLHMRERAEAVGGSFSAGPCEWGWSVRTVLPVPGLAS